MKLRATWLIVITAGFAGGWLAAESGADEAKPAEESKPAVEASAAESTPLDRQAEDEYYEILSLLVDTIDQVERNYVQKLSRRELVEAAIQGILHKLDPYSNYIAPEDITRFRTSVEAEFGGIGIQVTIEDGVLKVLSPLVGSPAYRAGIQAGDRIVAIEDETTDGLGMDDAVKKLKGEVGTDVRVKVLSPDQAEPRELTLKREMVHLETVLGDLRKSDDRWDYMLDPDRKIGYIRLSSFSRDTADELRQVLSELKNQGLRGLVLDLRFNPGGLLTSAVDVSDLFLSKGRIVSTSGRNIEEKVWEARAENDFEGFPLAVLVNRYSASSSEIVAACLQDHDRAVVIGERTWGKGSVQNVVELEGGKSALKLTTAGYMRPSGKNIHRFPDATEKDEWGVVPDDGYLVRFSDEELRDFLESRRQRDFIRRKKGATEALVAVNDMPPAKPADEKSEEPKPAAEAEQPAADSKADDAKPDDSKPADEEPAEKSEEPAKEKPAADEPSGEKPAEEKSDETDAKAEDDAKANDSDKPQADQPQAEPKSDAAKSDDKFEDRQLRKALDYIKNKLSEASGK